MNVSIKLILLGLFIGFFAKFMINISTELKSINTNLIQINQTMQEQNKIFNTVPEGVEVSNEIR